MLTQIMPGIFRIKIPFQGNPLRDINIYILINSHSGGRHLMIDNGIDQPASVEELRRDIQQIGLDLKNTDFFLTHSHPDHCSNTPELAGPDSRIYLGREDFKMLNYGGEEIQKEHERHSAEMGVPEGDFFKDNAFKPVHPMYEYARERGWNFTAPADGDVINIGDFNLQCLSTPGHSHGHICLYESRLKVLFCGDHVLQDITPGILSDRAEDNSLGKYLESLEKVSRLDIQLALPAHRSNIPDIKLRIAEIQQHHQERLDEIVALLHNGIQSEGCPNAYRIAERMHWDVSYARWEDFPLWQRIMATLEAEAHLVYLVKQGLVHSQSTDGMTHYYAR